MQIEEFLKENNIAFKNSGENISAGWIGIQCPFCADTSFHCGITPDRKVFTCWRCNRKGPIKLLLSKFTSSKIALNQLSFEKTHTDTLKRKKRNTEQYKAQIDTLKNYITKHFVFELTKQSRNYLEGRDFDAKYLYEKHGLLSGTLASDFKFRIGIPVHKKREIINLTGRDISEKSNLRYKNLPNTMAISPIKTSLYNLDNCTSQNILVVEGPFDVFRIGNNCCATFGVTFTPEQVKQLIAYKNVFVLFDNTAYKEALKLAEALSPFTCVEILQIGKKDPALLSESEVKHIKKEIKI